MNVPSTSESASKSETSALCDQVARDPVSEKAPKPSSRILELDALRGLAAFSVVLYHYTQRYDQIYGHREPLLLSMSSGLIGVMLFFMISGFVILMSLERTRHPLDFIVGRIARLYPTYWVAIALTFSAVAVFGLPGREVSSTSMLLNLTMVQSQFRVPDVDGVYWTLFVELVFYVLMLSVSMLGLLQRIEAVAVFWLSILYSAALSSWIVIPRLLGTWLLMPYAHLFILGIMFYRIKSKGTSWLRYGIIAACLALQVIQAPKWGETLAVFLFAIVFFLIINNRLRAIALKPFLTLGTLSYALYLVHQNIGYIIIQKLQLTGVNPELSIVAAISVAIALSAIITYTIEQPALRWIKQTYKRLGDRPTAAHPPS